MRILVISPTPFFSDRGTHIRILEEALALEKRGHQITIATYHVGRDIRGEVKTEIDIRRVLRLLFWYKKLEAGPDWQKIILDIMLIRKVFSLALAQKPDILHGHLHEGAVIGWIVQKILFWRKMKLICDFHGSLTKEMISHGYLKGGLDKIFRTMEKFINNLGDFAVASSGEYSEEIKKTRKDGRIKVVLDGVNIENYKKMPEKEVLKKELELPPDKIIAVYAGALVSNKGTAHLYGAVLRVLDVRDNVFFVIGGFPAEETIRFIKENKLEKKARLVSPISYFDLPALLAASDIGIDPKESKTRQASGKVLQYMAAGLPVVCFDRPNNRAYLKEGGSYFSQDVSGEGIAKGVLYFAENPEKMKSAGALNKQEAERFGWDAAGKEIEKIYEDCFAGGK